MNRSKAIYASAFVLPATDIKQHQFNPWQYGFRLLVDYIEAFENLTTLAPDLGINLFEYRQEFHGAISDGQL